MTFSYRFQYITDVQTTNHQMIGYTLVQYNASGGTFTIDFPLAPTDGEVVAIKNVAFNDTPITIVSVNDVETPVGGQSATFEVRQEQVYAEWTFDLDNAVWRLTGISKPLFIPELWTYQGIDLALGTDTPIPLTFLTNFFPAPVFFQANAGNLECVRNFNGYFDLTGFFNFIAGGNNQDGTVEVELYAVAGTPTLLQGFGLVASSAVPRTGTFGEQRFLSTVVQCVVGDIIGLHGTGTGTMTSWLVSPSGLYARAV